MDSKNSMVSSSTSDSILQFAPLHSLVDAGFWRRFSNLKLDTLKIDESPISITGFYAPCSNIGVPNHLTLLAESLSPESNEVSSDLQLSVGNRNKCPIPGTMINTNTLESFVALDKKHLLNIEAKKIYDDIQSGKVEEDCSLLSRFLLISFADLKKWEFKYWFAFPALVLDPPATLINIQPASKLLSPKETESLSAACDEWRNSSLTTGIPFFVACISSTSQVTVKSLKDWICCQGDDQKLLFGFYDPCHAPNNPGWPLRNYLAFICLRWKLKKITFLCYREKHGSADMQSSLIGEALVTVPQGWGDPQCIPKTVGWETNEKGKLRSRNISLAESMDPERLAISAADLNLKLMKWRTLPSLNLDMLSSAKCLLLGAGTLGCQVARMLTGWGFRKMTLLDYGRVAMSNPVRQSLYNFEDSLNGGVLKAHAAVKNLKSILPSVEAEGIDLAIPMPGHPVPAQETERIIEDCKKLQALVKSHDVVFLLTDTRESRWLPSLLCAKENKIAITAALGFDSYLVMRHGAGPNISSDIGTISTKMETLCTNNEDNQQRLGCYFCSDVVAPINSTSNRTLDQQCTVTRPGLAPIASALAVELLVGVLHHPNGICAPGEISNSILSRSDQSFGILPHQIRGTISQFSQMMLLGHASNSCTACSDIVVSEYKKRGMEFVLQAINHPTYLEDLTGLTELMNAANTFEVDWDDSAEEADF